MLQPKHRMKYEDLSGKLFGRWKVIKQGEYVHHGTKGAIVRTWICQCQCENKTIKQISEYSLKSGNSKSCGCLQKEAMQELGYKKRKLNQYDLSGEYGIGYTSNTNEPFYFDLEDYDKIKNYTWFRDGGDKYIVSNVWKDRKYLYLHKFVMGTQHMVDHKNRNKLDCRKDNLRLCSVLENSRNRSIYSTNSSGCIGVSWKKDKKKWKSYITINKKQIHLGYFDDKEEAVIARLKAEKEYFGEFAPQTKLIKKYKI